jgi:hypothetical protein
VANGEPTAQIFFDANLLGAAKALEPQEARIVYPGHPAWPFDQDEADEVWLPLVGGDHWLAITRDRRMRYRNAERLALIENRVRVVNVATNANLNIQGTITLLLQHWTDIETTLAQPPAFYHLTTTGLATMLRYD